MNATYEGDRTLMNTSKRYIKHCLLFACTALLLTSGAAMADRGHGGGGGGHWHSSVGIYVGSGFAPGYGPGFGPGYRPYYGRPYYGPNFYGDPYYYGYPPAVVYAPVQQPVIIEQAPQPTVYVEQTPAQAAAGSPQAAPTAAAQQDYSWYHCDQPEGYYPYVKECPQGWQKVKPEPPK